MKVVYDQSPNRGVAPLCLVTGAIMNILHIEFTPIVEILGFAVSHEIDIAELQLVSNGLTRFIPICVKRDENVQHDEDLEV